MKVLIVTPIHDEIANISQLATQLAESSFHPALWVVVDHLRNGAAAEGYADV